MGDSKMRLLVDGRSKYSLRYIIMDWIDRY